MKRYRIELDPLCPADDIVLPDSKVDESNYDNNSGYNVWAACICDEAGNVVYETYLPTKTALDDYLCTNGLEEINAEWRFDDESRTIGVYDDDRYLYEIPCKCDVYMSYCRPKPETPRYELVWHMPILLETGDDCTLELLENGEQIDTVNLQDYPGKWDTEDPYELAEADILQKHGLTYDDVSIVTPW